MHCPSKLSRLEDRVWKILMLYDNVFEWCLFNETSHSQTLGFFVKMSLKLKLPVSILINWFFGVSKQREFLHKRGLILWLFSKEWPSAASNKQVIQNVRYSINFRQRRSKTLFLCRKHFVKKFVKLSHFKLSLMIVFAPWKFALVEFCRWRYIVVPKSTKRY